jgi:carboxyl-terminal processing protease
MRISQARRLSCKLLALCVWSLTGCSTRAQPEPATIESFEKVWKTVADRHWDPAYLNNLPGGRTWQQVHDEYRARIESAKSDAEARELISAMLGELKQSHYAVLSGGTDDLTPRFSGDGTIGVEPLLVGDAVLVRRVKPASPAAQTGVLPGWEILDIDGFDVRSAARRILARERGLREPGVVLRMLTLGRLSGPPGAPVRVRFADGAGEMVEKRIERAAPEGTVAQFGFLPPQIVEFEAQRLRGDTGYVRFNVFLDPANLMTKFRDAVAACLKCRGFIIDLRGNPGGLAILAATMSGFFVDQPNAKLGTLYQRDLTLKLAVNPRVEMFRGPLAVLVDGASVSTSEIMAGGLQDLKRARIFGTRTAGAALPSMIERLPNGDLFQYAMANYISEGGRTLEGNGVEPDVTVPTTREALLAGKDPVLDAALDWIYAPTP